MKNEWAGGENYIFACLSIKRQDPTAGSRYGMSKSRDRSVQILALPLSHGPLIPTAAAPSRARNDLIINFNSSYINITY